MLVTLTPNQSEIERQIQVAKDNNFEFEPDYKHELQKGWYNPYFNSLNELQFMEKLDGWDINKDIKDYSKWIKQYGYADNLVQIEDFYQKEINDPINKYVIEVSKIGKDPNLKGKGGGMRSHHNSYIGYHELKWEYLDDEDDIEFLISFHLYKIIE